MSMSSRLTWIKPLRHKLYAAAVAFVIAVIAVFGSSVGMYLLHESKQAIHLEGSSPSGSGNIGKSELTASVMVSYEDSDALALAGPLQQGADFGSLVDGDIGSSELSDWGPFLARHSGAAVGTLSTDITLTELGLAKVRVEDVSVQMTAPPKANISGTYIPIPHQGSGGEDPYRFDTDLDAAYPELLGEGSQESFPGFNIELFPDDPVTLSVDYSGTYHFYSWKLVVRYLVGNRLRSLVVSAPHGRPFMLTGQSSAYSVSFVSNYPANDPGYHLAPG